MENAESKMNHSLELLRVGEVAALLKCSIRQVYRLSASGGIPQPIHIGGMVRWRPEALQTWLEAHCPPGESH